MNQIAVRLDINSNLYLKDPQDTDLGRRILLNSIQLIDEIGLESFTFKKLAAKINSVEASIYRYFENKHLLFIYLMNWYWEWMSIGIRLNTMNLVSPEAKLKAIFRVVVDTAQRNTTVEFIDEDILHKIVVTEGTKAYHSKTIDKENLEGFFISYKELCEQIAAVITEFSPGFSYPRALASNMLEMANNHLYFAEHLPRLTDISKNLPNPIVQQVVDLLEFFVMNLLRSDGVRTN